MVDFMDGPGKAICMELVLSVNEMLQQRNVV